MVTNEEDVPRFSLRRGARFQETFRDEPGREAPDDEWLAHLGGDFDGDQNEVGAEDAQSSDAGDVEVAGDQLEPEIALHRRFGSGEAAEEPEIPLTSRAQLAAPPRAPVGESGRSSYRRKLEELAALAFDPSSPLTDSPPAGSPPAEQVAQPVHVDQPAHVDHPALNDAVSALAENLADLEEVLARTAAACSVARMVLRQGQALLDHPSSSPATSASVDRTPVVDLRDQSADSPEPGPRPRTGAHRHSPEAPALSRLITPLRRYGSVTLRDLLRPE